MEDINISDIPLEGSEELPSITNEANGNVIICQGRKGNNLTNNYNGVRPYVGMEFSTHNEAYSYYDTYAKENGFKIRREALDKSRKVSKTVISRVFSCNRSGKKRLTDRREIGKCINRRPDTRVGCAAKMRIKLTASNTWMISKFVEEHTNHDLTIYDKSSNHSYRVARNNGLKSSNISGNNELVIPKQCTNGKPWVQLVKDLQKRMENNPDFFFAFELDDSLTVTSVIWADEQTKIAYSSFGDVLVFDIACRTNTWNMSFASFTGVNHHRQSILFGCALLSNEKYESFTWLFRQWLICMNGKAPKAIITYQDSEICSAIKKVFPNTPYRFCPWHIRKHINEHLASLKTLYGDEFTDYFYKWAYSTNIEQCEQYWDIMKKKFNVEEEGHCWLTEIYCLREHWVDAYLKKVFWAGMTTGQLKERIDAFFDNYIDSQSKPEEFVQLYYKAVDERRASEALEDSRTLNRTPTVCISHPLEVQVGKIYSATILRLFQEELVGGLLLDNEEACKDGLTSVYIVGHHSEDKGKWQEVIFDASGKVEVSCTCGKFETDGILCRHILKVLHDREVQIVPSHYILQRWSMNARSDNATKTKVIR